MSSPAVVRHRAKQHGRVGHAAVVSSARPCRSTGSRGGRRHVARGTVGPGGRRRTPRVVMASTAACVTVRLGHVLTTAQGITTTIEPLIIIIII